MVSTDEGREAMTAAAWFGQWTMQLPDAECRAAEAAVDDLAAFVGPWLPLAGKTRAVALRGAVLAWMATAADRPFAQAMGTYLERLLQDPDWTLDGVHVHLRIVGRIRNAALDHLRPALVGQ